MRRACALAVGGLDPGGGAGILADVRAFHAAGVFGCAVATVLTVQSTDGLVRGVMVPARLVIEQVEEVARAERVRVVKLGAMGSESLVKAVAAWLASAGLPVVLDPVMLPTRGRSRLLATRALAAMRDDLVPQATLVTANGPEAAALTGKPVGTLDEARQAARTLVRMGASAALVKGGHVGTGPWVVDVLAIGGTVLELRGKRIALPPLHGGGCVLASLIAGRLARQSAPGRGHVENAVKEARRIHQRALRNAIDVGGAMRVVVP